MLTLNVAVQSALVGGFTALAVALLNNYFVSRSKEVERSHKRREWFLEKQARDAEEIIQALDGFIKVLAESFAEVDRLISNAYTFERYQSSDNDKSEEIKVQSGELLSKFDALGSMRQSWFTYDLARLTVWFDGSIQKNSDIVELGKAFKKVENLLKIVPFGLWGVYEFSLHPREAELDNVKKDYRESETEWKKLIEKTAEVQRKLVQQMQEG